MSSHMEQMKHKDRFYFNQFFPVNNEMISKKFINEYVNDPIVKGILSDPVQLKKCQIIGVIGRRCFHLFDKKHMQWLCSAKKLGYEKLT